MAWALVGTIGTTVQGAAGADVTTATFGTSEIRTAGNLLVAFVACTQTQTFPATPSDWYIVKQVQTGTTSSVSIFGRAATGSDAAPTIANPTPAGSGVLAVQFAEFSGVISGQPDQTGSQTGTGSPITATFAGASAATSELWMAAYAARYTTNRSMTQTMTSNHVTTVTNAGNNSGVSSADHYHFGYGTTNSISGADTAVMTLSATTSLTTDVIVGATFKLGVGTFSPTFTADALIRVVTTGSGTADAVVRRNQTGSATADAALASGSTTYTVTFTADSATSLTGRPTWVSPADGNPIDANPVLVFTMPASKSAMHFDLQLDRVATFDSASFREYKTTIDQTGWEYWNGSSWTPITSAGVANTYSGNQARFTVQSPLLAGTWYRRIRAGTHS